MGFASKILIILAAGLALYVFFTLKDKKRKQASKNKNSEQLKDLEQCPTCKHWVLAKCPRKDCPL